MPRKKKDIDTGYTDIEDVIKSVSGSMDDLTDCVVNDPTLVARLNALGFKSKNPNGMTYKEAIMCSQIANAVKGDLKSYKAVVRSILIGNDIAVDQIS